MATNPIDPAAFHDFERAGWERAAEHYPAAFGSLTRQTAASLLDAVALAPGVTLLDVATGPGHLAAAAAERGAVVHGVDFSPSMIAEAARRYPTLTFTEGDAEHLVFRDRTFDCVVMNFGILHLARPEAAIAEAFRVLKRGGRYGFTAWAPPEEAVAFGIVLRAIEMHGKADVGLPPGPPFFRFSEAAECVRCLVEAGFVDPEVRRLPLTWVLKSPDRVFDAVSRGGVRTSAVLRAQTPEALDRIRQAVIESVAQYAHGDSVNVPMPAMLASGLKR